MRQTVLAVDDETDILKLLRYNLSNAGYGFLEAEDGPEALELAKRSLPDLILLDVMLPNMDGNELLKRLKADPDTKGIPVVMLTAKGEEIDRVLGLELGADDYIVKPFSPRELLLRIKAVMRKGQGSASKMLLGGPLSIDTERFAAFADGRRLDLTVAEFRLLSALVNSRGRILGRQRLIRRMGGDEMSAGSRTIDTHIRKLRVKLGAYGGLIETVRGLGYRLKDGE